MRSISSEMRSSWVTIYTSASYKWVCFPRGVDLLWDGSRHSTSTTQQNEHVHDFVIGTEVHKITTSNNRAYRFLCATYKTLCGSRVYCQGKRVDRWDRGSGVALVYLAPRNPNQSKDTKACLKNHGMSEEYWCHSGSDIIVVNLLWP
jgi:hypothetical protein